MRIERLQLQNYRSFSACDLDLTGVAHGVLCCGPTGSGKSSLVDAILWACYGKSRSRRADGFVKIGKDTTSVTVEFAVNGGHYRVTRTRSVKTKAGKSDLQLQTKNGTGWTALSGKSIPDTEAKIEKLIGVGYDVLTSGNFSLQGQADRFSRAPVSERISVLSDLLGLSIYQTWRETAGRQARALDQEAASLEAQVVGAVSALAKRDEIEVRSAKDEQDALAAKDAHRILTDQRRTTERTLATLEAQLPHQRKARAAFADDRNALADRQRRRNDKAAKAERLTQILDKREEIGEKARQAEETARTLAERRDALTVLDRAIAEVRVARDRRMQDNVTAQRANAKVLQEEQKITTEAKGLAPMIAGCQKRAAVMEHVPCLGVDGLPDRCPLLADARDGKAQLTGLEAKLAALTAWQRPALLQEDSTADLDANLTATDRERRTLLDAITKAEQTGKTLAQWTALVPELAHAEADLPVLQAEIAALDEEIAALTVKLAGEAALTEAIRHAESECIALKVEIQRLDRALAEHAAKEKAAIQAIAQATEQLAGLDALAAQAETATAEAQRIRARHADLVALELFYRQAPLMILENDAIPAIETEANRLLARISASGMRLQLRTQREVKSRDALADGLDILITDQVGEREYEAYSGGQQFQIDSALRVALAKLQARKAGASIETLCLDEGFGALSPECLDAVLSALRAVQDEFPLLFVISHVEAMRDVFPARIEVAGGPQDSTAALVLT